MEKQNKLGHKVGIIYINLYKAFDALNYELLIAKLKCYVLDQNAVEFFRNYLRNHYVLSMEEIFSRCTTEIYTESFIVQNYF